MSIFFDAQCKGNCLAQTSAGESLVSCTQVRRFLISQNLRPYKFILTSKFGDQHEVTLENINGACIPCEGRTVWAARLNGLCIRNADGSKPATQIGRIIHLPLGECTHCMPSDSNWYSMATPGFAKSSQGEVTFDAIQPLLSPIPPPLLKVIAEYHGFERSLLPPPMCIAPTLPVPAPAPSVPALALPVPAQTPSALAPALPVPAPAPSVPAPAPSTSTAQTTSTESSNAKDPWFNPQNYGMLHV